MESQLEKEARFCQLMAHSSHDSAIDTDSLEWETEVVEFEKDRVGASGSGGEKSRRRATSSAAADACVVFLPRRTTWI